MKIFRNSLEPNPVEVAQVNIRFYNIAFSSLLKPFRSLNEVLFDCFSFHICTSSVEHSTRMPSLCCFKLKLEGSLLIYSQATIAAVQPSTKGELRCRVAAFAASFIVDNRNLFVFLHSDTVCVCICEIVSSRNNACSCCFLLSC